MKTHFELVSGSGKDVVGSINVIGERPKFRPYVTIKLYNAANPKHGFIKDKDLERFAVNILKSLKSDKLIK